SEGRLYFFNRGPKSIELWQTDGLTIGKVADCPDTVAYGVPGTTVDGRFYFNAFDSGTGEELWSSDGTQAGTGLVRDLVPGTRGSMPRELSAFNHHLIAVADTDGLYQTGGELWQSDGTPTGTIPLELNPTTMGSVIQELTLFQDRLYFSAYDSLFGQELWCSDGSSAGTQLVHDIATWGSSEPRELTVMGNQLFFFASGDAGYGLFRSDGTSASGSLIQLSHSSALSQLVATEDRLFFSDFTENGRELWTSDGTVKGTKVIQDINPGVSGSEPWFFDDAAIGNVMYFTADHATYGRELWRTDGTRKGTRLVRDLAAGAQGSNPDHLFVFAGALYFSADDRVRGRELWRTDGVKTTLVKDLAKGYAGSEPENLTLFQDSLYFTTREFSGVQLWKTNGTAASTIKVVDLPTLAGAYQLTVVNDQIFFVGNNNQLWSTDGTPLGTRLLLEAPTIGSEAGAIDHLTNANGHLYFTTRDSAAGQEVWRSDGTPDGTARVTDLNPHGDANPTNLTYDAANNKLYFTANDWLHGDKELFAINLNQPPTNLQLSTDELYENLEANSIIGWFLWLGVNLSNLTFQLVPGAGDADNQVFTIEGFSLRLKTTPDYETQPSYSIRVGVTDPNGASFERIFNIDVTDIHEMEGTSERDVLQASPLMDDLRGLGDRDVFNINALHLDRGDRLDGGEGYDRLRLIGATLAQAIHMDLSAENQFQFLEGMIHIPESPPTVITGMEGINLSKFGARGVLTGSASRNRLVGSPHADILTGNGGIDTFGLQALKDSSLSGIDVITDYGSEDRLMAPVPGTTLTAVAGEATELSAAAIGEVLTAAVFTPNSAQAFTVAGQSGVYIGFNDGVAGFDESSDGLLHLSSYTISALDPVVIL
ncbi:MAG: ELWxxDGT repeat protein, partial [Cyanobacteriota bacterium]